MESIFSRYRNLIVLLVVLLGQVIGLAVQVSKPGRAEGPVGTATVQDGRNVRLIRLWAAGMVTPFERGLHGTAASLNGLWAQYVDLRHTRDENRQLRETVDRLRLEQAMLREDALQGARLQALLKFQQSYIYTTTAAEVIGSSGSMQSRLVWINRGSSDGLGPDMAVITGDGIVGKVRDVFAHSAQVLLINDQTSGAGVVLETTRTRGILRGNAAGQPQVVNILIDSRIQPGEKVLTAGGDQIFPRGLPVGVVERVERDAERSGFINVTVKPAANLQHLDEVLVITSMEPHLSPAEMADLKTSEDLKGAEAAAELARKKAAAEMAERLPSLKDPNADPNAPAAAPKLGPDGKPIPVAPVTPKPLQAVHPDRFSPGGAADAPAAASAGDSDDSEAPAADSAEPKKTEPKKTDPSKPSAPKKAAPKPAVPKPQGRSR